MLEAGELIGNRGLILRFTMNARMAKMGVAAALFLVATLAASGAHAQWAVVGAACSPDGIMANSNGFLTCTGGVWVANPIRAGNLSTCNSGNAGYIRWSGSAFEGCNGTSWIQLAGGTGLKVYKSDGVTVLGNYLGSLAEPSHIANPCHFTIYADETTGQTKGLDATDCATSGASSLTYFSGSNCTGTATISGVMGYCCTGSANCTTNKCRYDPNTYGSYTYNSRRDTTGVCTASYSTHAAYIGMPLACGDSPCLVK